MSWNIYHGDCLEIMPTIHAQSVDAVICDPPYMVGSISVGNSASKAGTWADMENSAYWFSAWMRQCRNLLKPTGYLLTFGNWRSIPTLIRALSLCEMQAHSCLVWDKQWIGPAYLNALRPRYEVVMFAAMPEAKIPDRKAPDIYACKWMAGNMKTTKHPAEKPVELMRHLCRLVAPEGGVVLDPFCGSGSTGEAAIAEGLRFIGIEREAEYVEIAKERIAASEKGAGPLFAV
jgi:site-specific DNA-methyltransferase (adenine-specific)